MKFEEIITKKEILKVIEENGYANPTEIQQQIIPLIKEGKDVLGQSKTGTGKTLAFAASILDKIEETKITKALILAPTRELAIQIGREIENLGKYTNINVTCVYGSSSIEDQRKKLKKGSEIVIGTPGRVKDLINRRSLKITELDFFVLDEADEMLSMGFKEELEYIFQKTNKSRQVMLFSATMPKDILKMAKTYMNKDYEYISVVSDIKTADNIKQNYYLVSDKTRFEAMLRLMDYYNPERTIIFCRTKRNADDLLKKMTTKGYNANVIHGDITQGQRIATLDKFKAGAFKYLIATDVAARGIHVDDIEIVFNYNLPETDEAYVHRIGRTGRTDKSGIAITFVRPKEEYIIKSLEKHINAKIKKEDLPTIDDIMPTRINSIINKIDSLKEIKSDKKLFENYLNSLTENEKNNIISNLLEQNLKETLGSDFKTSVKVEETNKRKQRKPDENGIRIFMTIGKLDKIEKRELLLYIEKKAKVKEGTCTKVEIMTKFTFMTVKKDSYQKIFDSLNNTKYNGRTIRIEKAKK